MFVVVCFWLCLWLCLWLCVCGCVLWLRSGGEHWARMVVVEVRQGTLGVVVVEVRQGTLGVDGRG